MTSQKLPVRLRRALHEWLQSRGEGQLWNPDAPIPMGWKKLIALGYLEKTGPHVMRQYGYVYHRYRISLTEKALHYRFPKGGSSPPLRRDVQLCGDAAPVSEACEPQIPLAAGVGPATALQVPATSGD